MGQMSTAPTPALTAIEGVATLELKVIPTPGGPVLHMLRASSPFFAGFGELYFSEVTPGAVKAWKLHKRQTQCFAVPVGQIKVVLFDDRETSPSRGKVCEILLGRPDQYRLLRIPPQVWYGFTVVGDRLALLCNCADLPHDPEESVHKDAADPTIPYQW